jgi:NitT/TauT family transport system ATP-binding protein
VHGNIACVLEDHQLGRTETERRIDDVLRRTNLTDFKSAYPRQLSGGMKQRVAIARAMSVDPAVMLMDEPLSALDSQTRELLIDDLIELMSRDTMTAVYITHNLAEAVALGSKIVVMSRRPGRIRDIVAIDVPLKDRRQNPGLLAAEQARLWDLMRAEARAADLELSHV